MNPSSSSDRELVTIKEAMQKLGVCKRTVDNWIKLGKVESKITAGGGRRIFADTLWRPAVALPDLPVDPPPVDVALALALGTVPK